MTTWRKIAVLAAMLTVPLFANAQSASPAPSTMASPSASAGTSAGAATVTATCKDGTSFSGTTLRGACRGRGGVAKAASDTAAAPATRSAAATAPASSAPASAPSSSSAPAKKKPPQPSATAKPGGGPGLVWTNPDSKIYHCYGSRWYGRTKQGDYMTEAAAKSAGFHAAQNKACASGS
ncbi:MAG: signal peptide protein [Proteobacteria bacterium]|nr:signal peptide protein [Pseudomonadota bacterium]